MCSGLLAERLHLRQQALPRVMILALAEFKVRRLREVVDARRDPQADEQQAEAGKDATDRAEAPSAHLEEGGAFVVEAYVPDFLYRLRAEQYTDAEAIEVDTVRLDLLRHNAATQTIEESHVSLSRAGIHLNPVVQRYAWPSELDLMARLAGLRLKDRWGGWDREPFHSTSSAHVSVYGR